MRSAELQSNLGRRSSGLRRLCKARFELLEPVRYDDDSIFLLRRAGQDDELARPRIEIGVGAPVRIQPPDVVHWGAIEDLEIPRHDDLTVRLERDGTHHVTSEG